MTLEFRVRDFFQPRQRILKEVGIKPGYRVLDYGCGPGSYVTSVAKLVGDNGKVYAQDTHPLAVKMIQGITSKKHLTNVETIDSDCATGLPENSLDVVLLYDVLHDLADPECVLNEIHRTLNDNGILSISDHQLKEDEIVSRITEKGKFKLLSRGEKTYSFVKQLQL
jgi:ubiquinone/menaquinone biosynthesis C-methylase UbiE